MFTLFSSLESTNIVGNGSSPPQHFIAYKYHKVNKKLTHDAVKLGL